MNIEDLKFKRLRFWNQNIWMVLFFRLHFFKESIFQKDLFIIQHRGLISLIFYPIDDMGANSGLKPFIPQGNFWVLLIWSTRPGLKVHFVTFFSYHRIKKLLLQKVFVFLSNRIICQKRIKNYIHFVTKGSFRHFFV